MICYSFQFHTRAGVFRETKLFKNDNSADVYMAKEKRRISAITACNRRCYDTPAGIKQKWNQEKQTWEE